MKKELKAFLDEVQDIYHELWSYGHANKEFKLTCDKIEDLTSIKLKIHSEDLDYLTGGDIERCLDIANKHQETCFNTWHVEMTRTIIEAYHGKSVYIITPELVISLYQRQKEENQ